MSITIEALNEYIHAWMNSSLNKYDPSFWGVFEKNTSYHFPGLGLVTDEGTFWSDSYRMSICCYTLVLGSEEIQFVRLGRDAYFAKFSKGVIFELNFNSYFDDELDDVAAEIEMFFSQQGKHFLWDLLCKDRVAVFDYGQVYVHSNSKDVLDESVRLHPLVELVVNVERRGAAPFMMNIFQDVNGDDVSYKLTLVEPSVYSYWDIMFDTIYLQ